MAFFIAQLIILLFISFNVFSETSDYDLQRLFTSVNLREQLNQQRFKVEKIKLKPAPIKSQPKVLSINFQGIIFQADSPPILFINDIVSYKNKALIKMGANSLSLHKQILSIGLPKYTIHLKPGQKWTGLAPIQ